MVGRFILSVPLLLLAGQAGMIVTAIIYYRAIRKLTPESKPTWLMGISYLSTVAALAADVAWHVEIGLQTVWRPALYIVVSIMGIATTYVVIRWEVNELRKLQKSNSPELQRHLLAVRARFGGITHDRHDTVE